MKNAIFSFTPLVLLLAAVNCFATDSVFVKKEIKVSKLSNQAANISSYMAFFYDSTSHLKANDIDRLADDKWTLCPDTIRIPFKAGKNYWFRFTINNDTAAVLNRLFYFSHFDRVELYTKNNLLEPVEKAGEDVSIKEWSYPLDDHGIQIRLKEGDVQTYYLSCFIVTKSMPASSLFFLRSYENAENFQAFEIRARLADTLFFLFFMGCITFCLIYFICQYVLRMTDKIFLVYIIYLLLVLLYNARDFEKHYFLKDTFMIFEGMYHWGEALLSHLSYITYSLFILYFLDLKNQKNKFPYHFIRFTIGFIAALILVDIYLKCFVSLTASLSLFTMSRFIIWGLAILYLFAVWPIRKNETKYIIYGSLSLLVMVGINLLFKYMKNNCYFNLCALDPYSFWFNPINFTRIGLLLEIMFFSLGLAKKLKIEFAGALLKEDSNIENSFHAHETRSGLTALEGKIYENKDARRYLGLFRDYLNSTLELKKDNQGIKLKKEIELISRYFTLRQEDDDSFQYEITVENSVKAENVIIPPALLIPFVQNSIKYNTSDKKIIIVKVFKKKKTVCIQISDNGVGISPGYLSDKTGSSGLSIALRKIRLFNLVQGTQVKCTIENNTEMGKGTLVSIFNLPQT